MHDLTNPSVRAAIVFRLRKLTSDTPPRWGIMSSTQMLQHVVLAFRVSLGEIPVVETSIRRFDSPLYRFVALSLPIRWPKGIPAPREIDFAITPPQPAHFAEERRSLVLLMERFGETPLSGLRSTNPVLGPLTHAQWMRWGFRHTDHHLRQFGC